jgi:hypothetical protein
MSNTLSSKIFFVEGCKGGVGKSLMCSGLVDFMLARSEPVLVVETDTSNPELWSTYKDVTETATLDLDDPQGWIALVNAIEQMPDHHIVVNTAARNAKGNTSHGYTLYESLVELNRRLVTYFVCNHEIESLHLLKAYWQSLPTLPDHVRLHVVKNEFFAAQYDLYDGSKIRAEIEARGGTSLRLPLLARDVAELLRNKKLPIAAAMNLPQLGMGNRAVLRRWRTVLSQEIERSLGSSDARLHALSA